MNNKERIRAEILYKERKRERALKDKCPFVARRYEREITALLNDQLFLLGGGDPGIRQAVGHQVFANV